MPVAYVNSTFGGGYPQNPVSINHNLSVISGNDRIVLAFIGCVGPAPHTFINVTYNGVPMTQLNQITIPYASRISSLTIYYSLDIGLPASAGTYSLSYQTGAGAYDSKADIVLFSGANQSYPNIKTSSGVKNGGYSGNWSTSVTSLYSNSILCDTFYGETRDASLTGTQGASQTAIVKTSDVDELLLASTKINASPVTTTMSWTPSGRYYTALHTIAEIAPPQLNQNQNTVFFGTNF